MTPTDIAQSQLYNSTFDLTSPTDYAVISEPGTMHGSRYFVHGTVVLLHTGLAGSVRYSEHYLSESGNGFNKVWYLTIVA